jgi:hypothetical protein
MTSGEVDEGWAREHHGYWADEVLGEEGAGGASDAPANAAENPAPAE